MGMDTGRWLGIFSLPTQRCFFLRDSGVLTDFLFSAYAEVFPRSVTFSVGLDAFLCLRRGVSWESSSSCLL